MKMKNRKTLSNPFLIGDKIYLRPHKIEDLDTWHKWFNDPEVNVFLAHGVFPNTYRGQKQFFENMYERKSDLQLAIVDKKKDILVGTTGIHSINLINRNGDISIIIGNKDYWGRSFGKEAVSLLLSHGFKKLNLHKITAGMVSENIGSYKLFKSLGFTEEARLKEQIFCNGKYQDVIKFALFKRNYKSK